MLNVMKARHIIFVIAGLLFSTGTARAAEGNHAPGSPPALTVVPEAGPRILELINRERASAGLGSLTMDEEVSGIAVRWTRQMALAGKLSHNGDYLSQESLERLDATTVGENVAFADSVDRIHELLMNSPPHRANILQPDFRLVGVGAVRSDSGDLYLTEDFLTRRAPSSPADKPVTPAKPAPAPARHPSRPAPAQPVAAKAPRTTRAAPVPAVPSPAPPSSSPLPEVPAPVSPPPLPPTAPISADASEPSPAGSLTEVGDQGMEAEPVLEPGFGQPPGERHSGGSGIPATHLLKGFPVLAALLHRRCQGRRH